MANQHILENQLLGNTNGWTSSSHPVAASNLDDGDGVGFKWSNNSTGGYIETTFSCAEGTKAQINAIFGVNGSNSQAASYNYRMEVLDANGAVLETKTGSVTNQSSTGGNDTGTFEFTAPQDSDGPFTFRITEKALLNSVRVIEDSLLKLNDEVKVYNTAKRSYVSSLLAELEEYSEPKDYKTGKKAASKKTRSSAKSKKST